MQVGVREAFHDALLKQLVWRKAEGRQGNLGLPPLPKTHSPQDNLELHAEKKCFHKTVVSSSLQKALPSRYC